jgi:uncharacterized delta-60 repeat protein
LTIRSTRRSNAGFYRTFLGENQYNSVLPDGKIMVGGSFTGVDSQPIKYLVRLNSDGTRDTNFNSALADSPEFGIDEVRGLRVLPDGKLLVMGSFEVNGNWAYYARLNADGSLDTSMATGTNLTFDMLPLPDGDFIVCGPGAGSAVAHRVNSDGSPDPSFQISVFSAKPVQQCRVSGRWKNPYCREFSRGEWKLPSTHLPVQF